MKTGFVINQTSLIKDLKELVDNWDLSDYQCSCPEFACGVDKGKRDAASELIKIMLEYGIDLTKDTP